MLVQVFSHHTNPSLYSCLLAKASSRAFMEKLIPWAGHSSCIFVLTCLEHLNNLHRAITSRFSILLGSVPGRFGQTCPRSSLRRKICTKRLQWRSLGRSKRKMLQVTRLEPCFLNKTCLPLVRLRLRGWSAFRSLAGTCEVVFFFLLCRRHGPWSSVQPL